MYALISVDINRHMHNQKCEIVFKDIEAIYANIVYLFMYHVLCYHWSLMSLGLPYILERQLCVLSKQLLIKINKTVVVVLHNVKHCASTS